jgi:hypothetical protein
LQGSDKISLGGSSADGFHSISRNLEGTGICNFIQVLILKTECI